ncbi:MAG: hypothetical protein ACI4U3_00425 [Traorella sp.]
MCLNKKRYNEYLDQLECLFDKLSKNLSTIPIKKIRRIMEFPTIGDV